LVDVCLGILEKCFRRFAEEKLFDEDELRQKAEQVLSKNAMQLYRLAR